MPHFFLFPSILVSTEARVLLFCDFLEYCPRGKKKFAPFSYVCFSEGFTLLLLMYLNTLWMQWVFVSHIHKVWVVLCTFCVMSLNVHWSKKWCESLTRCNVFYVQAWHFRNFQIRASLCAVRAILSPEDTQQRIWKKLAHCRVLFITVRKFTLCSAFCS